MVETRSDAKARRRAQYLAAAAKLFAERGFAGVSIDDLGSAVGLSGPAVYRHFSNKEQILTELLVDVSERLLQAHDEIVLASGSDLDALRKLIEFHIDFAIRERDVIRVHDRELATLPPDANRRVRKLQRRYIDGWVALAGRLQPDISTAELDVRMHAVFGILNSTPYNERFERDADVRSILADMALMSVLGRPSSVITR